ncbi:uncharacterized protein LOC131702730 [Acipenser ruthenus]|uniref:uncharacterized protein LOC131702730 n=1 Tax=Acipenser ruthenus TaxID=7906 RepID=UPI002740A470|nr:uncharacterized protein LOC131702730 [Acipenser ruthenus]
METAITYRGALSLLLILHSARAFDLNFCAGKPNATMVDPESSDSYYRCDSGVTYHYQCSAGLVFNPLLSNCDFPSNAPTPNFCINLVDGLYPEPSNPSTFYQCFRGVAYYRSCSSPLLFNSTTWLCDFPIEIPFLPIYPPKLTEESNFCEEKSNGFYSDSENVGAFYHCQERNTTHFLCPSILFYNPMINNCDFPFAVPEPDCCAQLDNGLYPESSNPDAFYQCIDHSTYYYTCPFPLLFNRESLMCDFNRVVPPATPSSTPALPETFNAPALPESTTTPKLYNSNFCVNKPSLLYADPEDRTGFYRCENELTFYFTCHEGMVFDQKVLNCVVPLPAPSPTPTLSKTTNPPKLYNSNFCVNKPSLLYVDPEDRTGFYRCENELTFYFTCHEGMVFDQKVLNCVVPLPAPSPTPTLSKTTNPPKLYNSNFCVNKPSLLYADPEDRTGFYRCENELTFYFTCHEGMVFDQKVLNCVVPLPASSPTPTLSKTTNTPKLYNSNFCVNKPSLLYADPEDLTGFYRCENEVTFYFTCHEGMVFDQKFLNCVVPPAAPSLGFCILKPNGIYRDPGNRAGFYVCVKRRPFYKTCPTPLMFNPELLICDNLSDTADTRN